MLITRYTRYDVLREKRIRIILTLHSYKRDVEITRKGPTAFSWTRPIVIQNPNDLNAITYFMNVNIIDSLPPFALLLLFYYHDYILTAVLGASRKSTYACAV